MTDTSTSTSTPPAPLNLPTPTAVSSDSTAGLTNSVNGPGLADSINTAVKAAPELAHSPGLAVGVAGSGGDTAQRAQAVAHAANQVALDKAIQEIGFGHHGGLTGLLDSVGKDLTGAGQTAAQGVASVGKEFGREIVHLPSEIMHPAQTAKASLGQAASAVNKPLSVVQHEYRYLHDVEATHGLLAAIAASVPLAAGTIGGAIVGGGYGAILGGEAAVGLEGQYLFNDSWQRTQSNQYVDPRTGQEVSLGRDLVSSLHLGGTLGSVLQHTVDGISQLALDPLAAGGGLIGAARSAEGLAKTGAKLGDLWGGTAPVNAEDVERVFNQYGSVRRAFQHIAGLSAGAIAHQYRDLAGIADRLGEAKTAEDVAQVFKEVIRANELITTSRLPTMSATRVPFNWAGQALRNAPDKALGIIPKSGVGAVDRLASLLNPQAWSKRLTELPRAPIIENGRIKNFVMNEIDPSDNHSLSAFHSFVSLAENGHVADEVTTRLANTLDPGERMTLIRNSIMDVAMHVAGFNSEADVRALGPDEWRNFKETLDSLTGGGEPGTTGVYATDGRSNISKMAVGDRDMAAGILENHTGMVTLPDMRQLQQIGSFLRGERALFGKAGDFFYKWVTQAFFKRFVLLTASYGLHIALAELIPNGYRLGFLNLIKSGMEANMGEKTARLDAAPDLWNDAMTKRTAERAARESGHYAADLKAIADAAEKKAKQNDLGPIAGGVFRLMGGTRGLLPEKIDDAVGEKIKFFARLYHANDGHIVPPGVSADQHISGEFAPVDRQRDALRKGLFSQSVGQRTSKLFGLFHRSDPRFADSWQDTLGEIANSARSRTGAKAYLAARSRGLTDEEATKAAVDAVKAHLDSEPERELAKFPRHTLNSIKDPPPGLTPHQDWANLVVKNLKGATFSSDGEANTSLLEHIAKGEHTPAHELDDLMDRGLHPELVKGRQMVPDPENSWQKVANWGHHHVLAPMVNFLSREPIYAETAWREYERQLPQVARGEISDDQAFVLAQSRAANDVIKNVHNLNDRTQWTVTMRNFAPFYFAQEQAYRRMGRLLASNPGAFRRYQMTISAVADFTSNQQRNGTYFTVVPGTGFLTRGIVGALAAIFPGQIEGMSPTGMGWSTSSANVIFPLAEGFRPGVGPAYAIPIKGIIHLFQGDGAFGANVSAAASGLVGNTIISEDMWKQFVPNVFVQRVLEAVQGDDRSFSSSMMQQMISLDYLQTRAMDRWVSEGHRPTDPGHPQIIPDPSSSPYVWQKFLDRLRNGTRVNYITRALLGLVSPVSPEISVENWGLPAELSQDIQKAGDVSSGIQNFLLKHPDASAFTTFLSHFTVSGSLPASVEAEKWVNDHMGLIHAYPAAAAFLMPQLKDTTYSATVYNEQLAQGLRQRFDPLAIGDNSNPYNPNSFLDQLYVNAGNHIYYDIMLPAHLAQQADPNVDHTADNALWSGWLKSFEVQNPVWASWHASGDRLIKRRDAIIQLREIFAKGLAPRDSMSDDVKTLLDQYEQYQTAYVNRAQSGETVTDLKAGWQQHMTDVKNAVPQLAPIINSVFYEAAPSDAPTVGNS